jgi:hypothetical protein
MGLDDQGSIPSRGKIFLFSMPSKSALGPTQSPIQRVLRTVSPEVTWLEREADH